MWSMLSYCNQCLKNDEMTSPALDSVDFHDDSLSEFLMWI